jgi:hypothetical protein
MSMPEEELEPPRSELSAEIELIRGPFPEVGPGCRTPYWRPTRKNISASAGRNFNPPKTGQQRRKRALLSGGKEV